VLAHRPQHPRVRVDEGNPDATADDARHGRVEILDGRARGAFQLEADANRIVAHDLAAIEKEVVVVQPWDVHEQTTRAEIADRHVDRPATLSGQPGGQLYGQADESTSFGEARCLDALLCLLLDTLSHAIRIVDDPS
jgi:hypothetical protein